MTRNMLWVSNIATDKKDAAPKELDIDRGGCARRYDAPGDGGEQAKCDPILSVGDIDGKV